jgi:hypothetical protein
MLFIVSSSFFIITLLSRSKCPEFPLVRNATTSHRKILKHGVLRGKKYEEITKAQKEGKEGPH